MSASGQKQTFAVQKKMAPTGPKADIPFSIVRQLFQTFSQYRRLVPSPKPPKMSLALSPAEHLRHPLLPRLHLEVQESPETRPTLSERPPREAL